ncbi:MAG: hypothetical protein IPH06_07040 [Alphaproteobacteria bacterium]|nr:hypothetical protein [Alphaproteobacteria bacterium]QQS57770.1 MAG: hypothetical protein IPN28_02800 [Alphaproteobacteria bacterium]
MAKRRLATSLLAGCLVTTCIGTLAFAGDPELYFYPTQRWSVAAQGGDESAPTCALSNSFNNGFAIKISGDRDGFDTLDLDFRQSSFEAGRKYEIVYSVPGGSREVFQATAAKGSVLSSSISSKADFAAALQDAATLDLSIQSNQFRLYLTGFAKAMDEYNTCINPPAPAMAAIDEVENPPELAAAQEAEASLSPAEEAVIMASDSSSDTLAPPEISSPPADEAPILSQDEQTSDKKDILAKIDSLANEFKGGSAEASAAPEPAAPDAFASSDAIPAGDISDSIPQDSRANIPDELPPLLGESAPEPAAIKPVKGERYTEKLARQLKEQGEPSSSSSEPARAMKSPPSSSDDNGPAALPPREETSSASAEVSPAPDAAAPKGEIIHFKGERVLPKKKSASPAASSEEAKSAPEHTSVTIPAYKMTKQTTKMEADFTDIAADAPAPDEAPAVDDAAFVQASFTDEAPDAPSAIEPSSGAAGEDFIQMRDKIRELEQEVGRLSKENSLLDTELKTSLKDSEDERLSVSSDNWNLERATMRYNEAERQIKRLGRQLQAARQQCTTEKQELETMLFDPQVTEQSQLAKLSAMEQELASAQSELQGIQRKYEERIRLLEAQLETP